MSRVVRTRDAIEVHEGDVVVTRASFRPGPTHTLLDVIAAVIVAQDPPPSDAVVLGFAAGGLVAPLRALASDASLFGIDLDPTGEALFREASGAWAGDVRVQVGDAVAWLEAHLARHHDPEAMRAANVTRPVGVDEVEARWVDPSRSGGPGRGGVTVIVDDLSTVVGDDVQKPFESIEAVPRLAASCLAPDGIFISNVLPWPGIEWSALIGNIGAPFECVHEIRLEDYENRVLLGSRAMRDKAEIVESLAENLAKLGSRQAGRFEVVARKAHD